jgi:hypothetical protein
MFGKDITSSMEQAATMVSRPLDQDGNAVTVGVDNLKRNFS